MIINQMLGFETGLNCDTNGDGTVDVDDLNLVINVLLGLVPAPSEVTTFTVNGVTFTMVTVEGGTFTMGASDDDTEAGSDETPAHQVTLTDFSIGSTEVTQEVWQAVMGTNPSYFTGDLQRPVECVSWNTCSDFLAALNQLTGKTFRLPTEAEWEYAARGGKKSKGYKYAGSDIVDEVAWYKGTIPSNGPQTVATKKPNELGLYDMSGNVWEWCADWYDKSYYSNSPGSNPTGPTTGYSRVHRGGTWSNPNGEQLRVSNRDCLAPRNSSRYIGLRLAL
ncbi:MAG: SUMF1/EgtB/PvdO family nonheme iron enzyme [Muribaculaceae bacterium]|nr:SUMF1/EgtB/PvdO family nonheme iron enzyme [Muribaculaceae bacterium]